MRTREQRRGAGCLSFGAGTLLRTKDRGQEIGGSRSIGKEGSCKNQILLTWEGSKRQGRKAGCRGDQEMGDGEAGWREYWTPGSPGTMPGLDFLWQW